MQYYAHIRRDENTGEVQYQTVAEHLRGTAALCRAFAREFGAEADGELAGLTHDLGKCTDAFQNRLLRGGAIVDHATAGAVICARQGHMFTAACVAGHHGGLADFGSPRNDKAGSPTLLGRLRKGDAERLPEHCGDSGVTIPPHTRSAVPEGDLLMASYWTRMLYSCLVDADFLDTEHFMQGERGRGGYDDM